jgi:hypothetical protein
MPTTIQITTDNYDGQTAIITYYPDTGGTINLGTHILPYDYNADYFYGTYSLYFPAFDTTCTLVIENESPTMCFEYIGQGPDILYQCSVIAQPTLYNGRYYWVLNGCPTEPNPPGYLECPTIDNNNYIWWSGSSWVHTSSLGGGSLFTTLSNPGLLPIEILGTYEWTSEMWGTCAPEMKNSTLGSCLPSTPTPTPTPTMTPTPTPTPTQTKQYYVYKLCGDAKVAYVVQTQPGLTTTPGKVIRTTIDEYCWEFLYQTTNQNPIPSSPLVQIVNWDGDYLTPSLGIIFDNCTDCLSYATDIATGVALYWHTVVGTYTSINFRINRRRAGAITYSIGGTQQNFGQSIPTFYNGLISISNTFPNNLQTGDEIMIDINSGPQIPGGGGTVKATIELKRTLRNVTNYTTIETQTVTGGFVSTRIPLTPGTWYAIDPSTYLYEVNATTELI